MTKKHNAYSRVLYAGNTLSYEWDA